MAVELCGPRHHVQSVTLASDGTQFVAALSGQGEAVALSIEGAKHRTARYTPLQDDEGIRLMERAILTHSNDTLFTTALRMVRDIVG
jgi:hypothetical protein